MRLPCSHNSSPARDFRGPTTSFYCRVVVVIAGMIKSCKACFNVLHKADKGLQSFSSTVCLVRCCHAEAAERRWALGGRSCSSTTGDFRFKKCSKKMCRGGRCRLHALPSSSVSDTCCDSLHTHDDSTRVDRLDTVVYVQQPIPIPWHFV